MGLLRSFGGVSPGMLGTPTFIFTTGSLPVGATLTRASSGTRVDASGVLVSETTDVARFTYDPVTLALQGLLNEPQRTNLLLNSADQSVAPWTTSGATPATAAGTSPAGTNTAVSLTESAATAAHRVFQTATLTAVPTSFSVYAKASTRSWLYHRGDPTPSGNVYAYFDLTNGVVGSLTGSVTSAIVAAGSGWYRTASMFTAAATGDDWLLGMCDSDRGSSPSYAGDGSSKLLVYGAQVEVGATASSYIPTAGAAVTRSLDVLTLSGLANGTYTMTINRLSGQTVVTGASVVAGTYVVPTDVSPLQSVIARRTA